MAEGRAGGRTPGLRSGDNDSAPRRRLSSGEESVGLVACKEPALAFEPSE